MNHTLCSALLLALVCLGSPGKASAHLRNVTDTNSAWQNYQQNDIDTAPSYQFPHASCFRASAARYELPESLLLAVARGESDFDASARSKANAHGIMQIQWPQTAHHLGIYRLTDLYDPCTNIDAGARYLKELITRYGGNIHFALAAYNYGPGRISTTGHDIPQGAEWYSGYIFRHLTYILGDKADAKSGHDSLYSELGRTTLVSFGEPYRAAAFVAVLEKQAPKLQLDWFRKDVGKFEVVLTYDDQEEFRTGALQLANAGFPLDQAARQ